MNYYSEQRYYDLYHELKHKYTITSIEGVDRVGKTTLLDKTKKIAQLSLLCSERVPLTPYKDIHILDTHIFITLPWRGDKLYPILRNILDSSTPLSVTPEFRRAVFSLFEQNSYMALTLTIQALKTLHHDYNDRQYKIYLDRSWVSGFAYQSFEHLLQTQAPLDTYLHKYHLYPINTLYFLYPSFTSTDQLNSYDRYSQENQEALILRYEQTLQTSKELKLIQEIIPIARPQELQHAL